MMQKSKPLGPHPFLSSVGDAKTPQGWRADSGGGRAAAGGRIRVGITLSQMLTLYMCLIPCPQPRADLSYPRA